MTHPLDKISRALILPRAVVMALALVVPEPHLWKKLKILAVGTLSRSIDIFDLFWHLLPLVISCAEAGAHGQPAPRRLRRASQCAAVTRSMARCRGCANE